MCSSRLFPNIELWHFFFWSYQKLLVWRGTTDQYSWRECARADLDGDGPGGSPGADGAHPYKVGQTPGDLVARLLALHPGRGAAAAVPGSPAHAARAV
eukprot:scaffold3566_cov119-Isochrysis_galbana.AAC.10